MSSAIAARDRREARRATLLHADGQAVDRNPGEPALAISVTRRGLAPLEAHRMLRGQWYAHRREMLESWERLAPILEELEDELRRHVNGLEADPVTSSEPITVQSTSDGFTITSVTEASVAVTLLRTKMAIGFAPPVMMGGRKVSAIYGVTGTPGNLQLTVARPSDGDIHVPLATVLEGLIEAVLTE